MRKWYHGEGADADVVMAAVAVLSRNLADAPFPSRMSDDIRRSTAKKIYAALKSSEMAGEFDLVNLAGMRDAQAASYVEKMLISRRFLQLKDKASFILSKNEDVSVMLCEEDHMKITAFAGGKALDEAYAKADRIDDIFIRTLKIAFSDKLGFLTASPVNLGTGLSVSYLLHLPGLKQEGAIYRLSSMVSKLGLSLRERFTGSDFYVLTNHVTLGISEKSAVDNLTAVCDQIVLQERAAREQLKENDDFEDKIYRAMGILQTARRLYMPEFFDVLSKVRLGAALQYLPISYQQVGEMLYTLQNASLLVTAGKDLTEDGCAKLRAQIIREELE